MSYERQKQTNPNYDPTKPECAVANGITSKYSVGMGSLMDGKPKSQLDTDVQPVRLVGETYGLFDFLKPTTTRSVNGNGVQDMVSMNKDIDKALLQSKNAFTVAKASWNNQIEYFKVSFREIDTRQKALANAMTQLANNLTANRKKLASDQAAIEDASHRVRDIVKLGKAILVSIKRVITTFTTMSTDESRIMKEAKHLAVSFGKLATNITKLKKIN